MTIVERLKIIAPLIAFSVSRTKDDTFKWDGSAPDPEDLGYSAYTIDVFARTIANGVLVEGRSSLSGSYFKPDEEPRNIHGYLSSMLLDASEDLLKVPGLPLLAQDGLKAAIAFLNSVTREEWELQQKASTT